ncbi:hypothetical protein H0H92_014062 [Tricholoma furcatifolium]|nr:hypothetical protein H0H92_014062 [Tricholoma furcatifolium]
MDTAQQVLVDSVDVSANATVETVHHIISGSFRSFSLFLLAFSPLHRTLDLVQTVDAFGPHQYLATNQRRDRVYATSWALPPALSSWSVDLDHGKVEFLNSVPITATSSYINIPPPYTHAYSAGGPTGEVHTINPSTGALDTKIQQLLFVPEDELEAADKTRVALRYGSHGVEFSAEGYAFIPVLGTDSIEMYKRDPGADADAEGKLVHIASVKSPRGPGAHDGPRHVKVHPNGKVVYCVTEHSESQVSALRKTRTINQTNRKSKANFVDAYRITPTGLDHLGARSLIPLSSTTTTRNLNPASFRGDTLLLTPSTPTHPAPQALFATTRGAKSGTRGWLSVFPLDRDGMFADADADADADAGPSQALQPEYWETPTSGGKANALDIMPKTGAGAGEEEEGVWVLLTDDDDVTASASEEQEGGGGVRVLEWDGFGTGGVRIVAGWPEPGRGEVMQGGSHALWLD